MKTSIMAKATTTPVNPGPVTLELAADLSPAVIAIERAYAAVRKAYPDAPAATIVVKRDANAWGHTTVAKVWAPAGAGSTEVQADSFEIMISGENLRRGAVAVMATLLHEAAHARNLANGVLDTDQNGRHNRAFADVAESHGLEVTQAGWHGWNQTTLTEEGLKRWARTIKALEAGMAKAAAVAVPNLDHLPKPKATSNGTKGGPVVTPVSTPVTPRKRGNRNLPKAQCDCGNTIRLSRGLLESAAPVCPDCGQAYMEVVAS